MLFSLCFGCVVAETFGYGSNSASAPTRKTWTILVKYVDRAMLEVQNVVVLRQMG